MYTIICVQLIILMFLFVYLLFFNHFSTCNINNVRCNVHTAGNVMTSLNFLLQFWLGIQGFLWFTFLLICLCYTTTEVKKSAKNSCFILCQRKIKYFSKIFINEKLELEMHFDLVCRSSHPLCAAVIVVEGFSYIKVQNQQDTLRNFRCE